MAENRIKEATRASYSRIATKKERAQKIQSDYNTQPEWDYLANSIHKVQKLYEKEQKVLSES